jgi:hypothetical protein
MRASAIACAIGLASSGCNSGDSVPPGTDAATASPGDAASTSPANGVCIALRADAQAQPVGAPCVSYAHEGQALFGGFLESDVTIEMDNPQCGANVCLYNHFRGRVTCPYGQDATGRGPDGLPGCLSAGSCDPVRPTDLTHAPMAVPPQCADRTAALAVYCSCRCANASGATSDGTYCACPSGTTCTQLIPSGAAPSPGQTDTSGAYCLKTGTEWPGGACPVPCDPKSAPCP